MRVLYIGGTGEISYECVRASVAAGQDVTVFNRGRSDEPLPASVRQVVGDLAGRPAIAALADEHFDAVCQFISYAPEHVERDKALFAGKTGQYVFISSASAYQKPPAGYVITERTPLVNPYWTYSAAKARCEALLMRWHAASELPVTIVRPSHTCRRRLPGTFVSGDDWAWRMCQGRPILVHGDGTSLWTLTHSRDFARPFVRLLGNDRALGEAFHITTDESNPWNGIFEAVGQALGVEPKIVHVPTDTLVRFERAWEGPLLGDKTWSVVFDNTKVRSVAGAFDCLPMIEVIRGSVEHYRRRAETFAPDQATHALLDRIADRQRAVAPPPVP